MWRAKGLLVALLMGVAAVEVGLSQAAEHGDVWEITIDEFVRRALAENPELQAARAEGEMGYTDALKHVYEAVVEIERAGGLGPR
jgi:hypothetical protein